MLDNALHRRGRPVQRLRYTAPLLSSDTPLQRAENIVHMLAMTGDPAVIAAHVAVVADVIEQYQAVDREAGQG